MSSGRRLPGTGLACGGLPIMSSQMTQQLCPLAVAALRQARSVEPILTPTPALLFTAAMARVPTTGTM
eukprot:5238034-Alexandrium_andersonii.AAC.1